MKSFMIINIIVGEKLTQSLYGFFNVCFVALRSKSTWGDGQFTEPHSFLGKLEQAVNQYFMHILLLVTDNSP